MEHGIYVRIAMYFYTQRLRNQDIQQSCHMDTPIDMSSGCDPPLAGLMIHYRGLYYLYIYYIINYLYIYDIIWYYIILCFLILYYIILFYFILYYIIFVCIYWGLFHNPRTENPVLNQPGLNGMIEGFWTLLIYIYCYGPSQLLPWEQLTPAIKLGLIYTLW